MSDSPWSFNGESASVGGGHAVTLVDGSTFMLSGRSGDVIGDAADGLFMLDTRVLSRWVLRVNGQRVEPLTVIPNGPFASTFVGRVDVDGTIDAPVVAVQRRHVGRGMREDLEIRNYGTTSKHLVVELEVAADFHGLFAVKAGVDRAGGHGDPHVTPDGLVITPPVGVEPQSPLDHTAIASSEPPDMATTAGRITWNPRVEPGSAWTTCLEVSIRAGGVDIEPTSRCGTPFEHAIPVVRLRDWRDAATQIETSSGALARAVEQSVDDLGALRIFDPEHTDRVVVAAGAPWFMTLFGRDSLLTSWMALPIDRQLARGVLAELGETQGRRNDEQSEEQPGRILHEVRFDRWSARLLGGNGRYYGSVDATPLFVNLVAELVRWNGPTEQTAALLPAVDRALEWITDIGDRDGDGFVEYLRPHEGGLEHQGWKDSWDGIRHRDGRIAVPPVALCEVQGYVYAAFRSRAALARAFGEPADTSRHFEERAEQFRQHFDDAFWMSDVGWYAVGLDEHKLQIGSLTSNLGHLLWTGIVPPERSARIAELLTAPELNSGWGVRTLASDAAGYNPLSYHCGSVWPHDTAIAIAGLARYHCDDAMHTIVEGLVDASACSGGRLPELFGGFARDDIGSTVPYPASCSPQAWAAASPLLIVRSLLGLDPDVPGGGVTLRPRLPASITSLRVRNIPIGASRLTINVDNGSVETQVTGDPLHVRVD